MYPITTYTHYAEVVVNGDLQGADGGQGVTRLVVFDQSKIQILKLAGDYQGTLRTILGAKGRRCPCYYVLRRSSTLVSLRDREKRMHRANRGVLE
jgi:hypothetical protein